MSKSLLVIYPTDICSTEAACISMLRNGVEFKTVYDGTLLVLEDIDKLETIIEGIKSNLDFDMFSKELHYEVLSNEEGFSQVSKKDRPEPEYESFYHFNTLGEVKDYLMNNIYSGITYLDSTLDSWISSFVDDDKGFGICFVPIRGDMSDYEEHRLLSIKEYMRIVK